MTTPTPSLSEILAMLHHNQIAIAAAVEELALWASRTGGNFVHEDVHGALATLDANAKAIESGIGALTPSMLD